jgi:hypothetical protein
MIPLLLGSNRRDDHGALMVPAVISLLGAGRVAAALVGAAAASGARAPRSADELARRVVDAGLIGLARRRREDLEHLDLLAVGRKGHAALWVDVQAGVLAGTRA